MREQRLLAVQVDDDRVGDQARPGPAEHAGDVRVNTRPAGEVPAGQARAEPESSGTGVVVAGKRHGFRLSPGPFRGKPFSLAIGRKSRGSQPLC